MTTSKQLLDSLNSNPLIFTEYPQNLFETISVNETPFIFNAHYLNNIKNINIFMRNLQHIKIEKKINISNGELIFLTENIIKLKGLDGIFEFNITGYKLESEFQLGDYLLIDHSNMTIQKLGVSSTFYSNKIDLYIPLEKTNIIIDQIKKVTLYEIDSLFDNENPKLDYIDIQKETDLIVNEYIDLKHAEILKRNLIIENYEELCEELCNLLKGDAYLNVIKVTKNKTFFSNWTGNKEIWELPIQNS